jgi:long-chain-fatty-acid--CoA ligase ACSBG
MMGYLKNEDATRGTIDSQGFCHSGDRGKIDSEGFLRITGRIKELIISAGGENIAPVIVEDNFKLECAACSNIMMVGEMQRFMAALITFKVEIDPKTGVPSRELTNEAKLDIKKNAGVDVTTTDEACSNPKVSEYVKRAMEAANKKSVSRAAHIRKFKFLLDDFSVPSGELTPTLKLKRNVTEKKYKQYVDEMFAPEPKM